MLLCRILPESDRNMKHSSLVVLAFLFWLPFTLSWPLCIQWCQVIICCLCFCVSASITVSFLARHLDAFNNGDNHFDFYFHASRHGHESLYVRHHPPLGHDALGSRLSLFQDYLPTIPWIPLGLLAPLEVLLATPPPSLVP